MAPQGGISVALYSAPLAPPKHASCGSELRACVVGHLVVKTKYESHAEYDLVVALGRETWKVRRRFSQFVQLQEMLRRDTNVTLPKLPAKIWSGVQDLTAEWLRELRQESLEQYLQAVLRLQASLGDGQKTLYSFLQVGPEALAQIQFPLLPLPEDTEFCDGS